MSGLRRPSQDYQLLALEAKLESLKLEPIEEKERLTVFQETKRLVDKYIADRAEKLPLQFKPTVLVGSMADGSCVGMPQYDLQLPIVFDGAEFTAPVAGCVEVRVTRKVTPDIDQFVAKNVLDPEKVRQFAHNLVLEAVEYYKTMSGTFPKHTPLSIEDESSRVTVKLIDKRDGEHTATVFFVPMLQLYKDGVSQVALPERRAEGSTKWQLNFINRETSLVGAWEKEKTETGCQKACLRLMKALITSRYSEIPRFIAKAIVLKLTVDSKNSDSLWNHEEMSSRFIDLVKNLEAGLRKKEILSIHTKQQGGEVNILKEIKPEAIEKAHKRLSEDIKMTANGLINLIKVDFIGGKA